MTETVAALVKDYLHRHDPVERAKRAGLRSASKTNTDREAAVQKVHQKHHSEHNQKRQRQNHDQNHSQNHTVPTGLLPEKRKSKGFLRQRFSAAERHAVMNRDGGRCTFVDAQGVRCKNERWVELHHTRAVSLGGTNDPNFVVTVCASHHDLIHQYSLPIAGQMSWLQPP